MTIPESESRGPLVTWQVQFRTHVPVRSDTANLGFNVKLTDLDGNEDPLAAARSAEATQSYKREKEFLQGRIDTFSTDLPAGYQPAAVSINHRDDAGDSAFRKGGEFERVFVERIILKPVADPSVKYTFTANSYVSAKQGWRLFVRDDAWTGKDLRTGKELRSHPTIRKLQASELQEIRGEGLNANVAQQQPRKPGDRIYRFAAYNDLGKHDPKDPKNNKDRPTLGGSAEFPYPRRLDTNRGWINNTVSEEPPTESGFTAEWQPAEDSKVLNFVLDKNVRSPWVPEDDNFDSDKATGFLGNGLLSALPSVLTQLDNTLRMQPITKPLAELLGPLGLTPGDSFESFNEVLNLYDNSQLQGKKNFQGLFDFLRNKSGVVSKFSERTGLIFGDGPAGRGTDGFIDLLKFDLPKSLYNRLETWQTDEEFGRMFLAGTNPVVIEAVNSAASLDRLLGRSTIKDNEIKDFLEGHSFAELAEGKETRLFVVDHWLLYDLLPEIIKAFDNKPAGVQHAGRAVLFRRKDGHLVPVAIELAFRLPDVPEQPPTVYTPKDPANVWLLAKFIFNSIDNAIHQLVSHWLRTHCCVEPYMISTRRQLSPTHPIFRLMMPHFRYTLAINAAARALLINAGGAIEDGVSASVGPYSMPLSSKLYGLTWQFKNEGIVADLKKRGFLSSAGASAADLLVKDYPYAEDGLDIWAVMHGYFTEFVDHYYKDDSEVLEDEQLNAWWKDIQEEGHPDAPKAGWIELKSKSSLVDICCTIAWVASAHHAAVNFGQFDYCAWMVTHAPLCRRPAPAKGSKEWEVLSSATGTEAEQQLLTWLSPPVTTTKAMALVKTLSAHAEDEQYLSSVEQEWLPLEDDPAVKEIFEKFTANIKKVEANNQARNDAGAAGNPLYLTRNPGEGGLPYTMLLASSEPGVTMRGIPYSISI